MKFTAVSASTARRDMDGVNNIIVKSTPAHVRTDMHARGHAVAVFLLPVSLTRL